MIKMKKTPIAHYTGGVGVVGSNPAAPTNLFRKYQAKPSRYLVYLVFSCSL